MKIINSERAPKAVGPYSQAVVANGFIFCAGQIGIDPQRGDLLDGVENQTHQAIKNLQAVLEEAESSLEHIVKTTIFIQDMNDYAKINEIYGSYFNDHKPARATVEVARLPKDALVEIDAVAIIK
jgi:2-iminobutanoate/2-iminopropanoate deaminase